MTGIRRFFTFLFSHIGLLALVSGYCILGGLTFQHLEKENELQVRSRQLMMMTIIIFVFWKVKRDMVKHRLELGDRIWNLTKNMDYLREENWTGKF